MDDREAVLSGERRQGFGRSLGILSRRADKSNGELLGRCLQEPWNEVGAVEVCGKRRAIEQLRGNVDADAVGQNEEIMERGRELGVAAGDICVVGVEEADFGEASLRQHLLQQTDGLVAFEPGHRNAEDIFRGADPES